MERCTRYNITPVFSINKTDHPDITEILSEVALTTTTLTTKCYIFILPSQQQAENVLSLIILLYCKCLMLSQCLSCNRISTDKRLCSFMFCFHKSKYTLFFFSLFFFPSNIDMLLIHLYYFTFVYTLLVTVIYIYIYIYLQ